MSASAALSPTISGSGTVSASPTAALPAGTAGAALLQTLPVKGRAPLAGYSRDQFGPAWTDANNSALGHNGCDTRNDILRRDLTVTTIKPDSHGCVVLTGTLADPYTATSIAFTRGVGTSNDIQIDHVVALGDAWQTGAQQLTAQRRTDFANDPLNLLAVDGPQNESKGDSDAASWLPPNKGYRCAYVARQVAVKAQYGLWVTQAEHDAIAGVLANCGNQTAARVPATTPSPAAVVPVPAPAPAPGAKTYANCAALNVDYPHGVARAGAVDHVTSGTPVTNFTVNDAVYNANAGSDRDGDGIACEKH